MVQIVFTFCSYVALICALVCFVFSVLSPSHGTLIDHITDSDSVNKQRINK
jgi:hypothetical protein